MNIAVVGGGRRCAQLINLIEQHEFVEIHPQVIAVASMAGNEGPGFALAKEKGLFTTNDYNDFFSRSDIDLIIELSGSMNIYNDLLKKKSANVRAISSCTAQLFWEISRVSVMQKKTTQELYHTKAMYKTMINELMHEDVLVIGYDYRIIDVNNTLLDRLGLKKENVIGKYCYEITHHQDFPCSGKKHPCPLTQTMDKIELTQTTHVHLDKDNKEIYVSISTYPLTEEGEIVGVIEISKDITKDINSQKVMMQQEKLASIGRLSAGVAHEINNPLTTILTTSMLLQEDIEPDNSMYDELETIAKETLRCRNIVTSLLDFARQSTPKKNANDVKQIIKESVLLTKKQAAFKDVEIKHFYGQNIPHLLVDKGQIQQALINLILNAIESSSPGGHIQINTLLSNKDESVHISVSDTGEGIAADLIDKVFDPFFTTKDDGTGLGLAITHGIIEQHGGTISVDSKVGQGTTFNIKLPLIKDEMNDS